MSLDAEYGALVSPQKPDNRLPVEQWERDFEPNSLTKLDVNSANSLLGTMDEIKSGWRIGRVLTYDTIIIWVVDRNGDVWFAIEELVLDGAPTGRPKHQKLALTTSLPKLGHPALVNCDRARIAGEIYLDVGVTPIVWRINNNSGRYGRLPSRTSNQLDNVAKRFADLGVMLTSEFIRA